MLAYPVENNMLAYPFITNAQDLFLQSLSQRKQRLTSLEGRKRLNALFIILVLHSDCKLHHPSDTQLLSWVTVVVTAFPNWTLCGHLACSTDCWQMHSTGWKDCMCDHLMGSQHHLWRWGDSGASHDRQELHLENKTCFIWTDGMQLGLLCHAINTCSFLPPTVIMMMMIIMMTSTFIACDSINLNAQFPEGGWGVGGDRGKS